jgi:solute carrier family 35 (UDP-sugar transporter), member A1/2/3
MVANLTSGLAAALSQSALQHHQRNLYLYGMELSSASFLLVLLSLLWSPDGQQIRREGVARHWKPVTLIPIVTHAGGGLLVGIVTKYAGSVQKGFALIFGVLLSGMFQKWLSREPVTKHQVLGGILACVSTWMHVSFPTSR